MAPSKPKPPDPKNKPPGPIPPGAMFIADDGSVMRLLPESGPDISPLEREHAAMINEAMYPLHAIRARCEAAGYDVKPVTTAA